MTGNVESSLTQLKEQNVNLTYFPAAQRKLNRILMQRTVVQHLAKHTLPMTGGSTTNEFGNQQKNLYQNSTESFQTSYFNLASYFVDWEL